MDAVASLSRPLHVCCRGAAENLEGKIPQKFFTGNDGLAFTYRPTNCSMVDLHSSGKTAHKQKQKRFSLRSKFMDFCENSATGYSNLFRRPSLAKRRELTVEATGSGGDEEAVAAASEGDWREFRARLVAQQVAAANEGQPAGLDTWQERVSPENLAVLAQQSPELAKEPPWAHPTAGPEQGGILLAAPGMNLALDSRYWQTVVLMVKHSPQGSWGLILNRPTGYYMSHMGAGNGAMAAFAGNAIYVGGFKSDGKTLHILHGHAIEGSKEVVPGVYVGGLEAAGEAVIGCEHPPLDFRFFVGQVEWLPGKLQEEVDKGVWYTAACARSLVLKQCLQLPKPLWREILELMGGEYAETSRKTYGDNS